MQYEGNKNIQFLRSLFKSFQIYKMAFNVNGMCVCMYSERQKYGINSLKIKQNFFQKNLCTGQF
jgi:hypothetical protein